MTTLFKKLAGTSAVFVQDDYAGPSPVERDGLSWSADELKLDSVPEHLNAKPAMANALALEGLEEYDPPQAGDVRYVNSLAIDLVYVQGIQGWVQLN